MMGLGGLLGAVFTKVMTFELTTWRSCRCKGPEQGPPSVTEKLKVGEPGADGVTESGQVTDDRRLCWQLYGLRFLSWVKQKAIEGSKWRRDVIWLIRFCKFTGCCVEKSERAHGRAGHLLGGCCSIQRRNGGGLDQAAGAGGKKGKILASELGDELDVEYGRKKAGKDVIPAFLLANPVEEWDWESCGRSRL